MYMNVFEELYTRELASLKKEVEAYHSEEQLWLVKAGITNSAGTLVLHLVGNLKHYIGAILGKSSYVRKREEEFSTRGISKSELLLKIEDVTQEVRGVLAKMSSTQLEQDYPILIKDKQCKIDFVLVDLLAHLSYHIGQISYHRRLFGAI